MKTIIKLCCTLLCCAVLVSCAPSQPTDPAQTAQPADPATTGASTGEVYQIVNNPNQMNVSCYTENGYYELLDWDYESYNFVVTDYATAEQRYLCSQSGCTHADENCSSYVSGNGFYNIFIWEDQLYLYSQANTDPLLPPAPYQLEVMGLDGSNRRVLTQIPTGNDDRYYIGYNLIAASKDNFLLLVNLTDRNRETDMQFSYLAKLNRSTGEISDYYRPEMPKGAQKHMLNVYGATDTGLIAHVYTEYDIGELPIAETAEEVARQDELWYAAQENTVVEIPFDGGEPRHIYTLASRFFDPVCHDGALYYIENAHFVDEIAASWAQPDAIPSGIPTLNRIDCATGQTKTLVADFNALPGFGTDAPVQTVLLTGFVDNNAVIEHYNESYGPSDGVTQEGYIKTEQYLVDLDSGDVQKIDLSFVYDDAHHDSAFEIMADAGDRLLVTADVLVMNDYYIRQYAVMTKADYYSSNPKYTMVSHLPQYRTTPVRK